MSDATEGNPSPEKVPGADEPEGTAAASAPPETAATPAAEPEAEASATAPDPDTPEPPAEAEPEAVKPEPVAAEEESPAAAAPEAPAPEEAEPEPPAAAADEPVAPPPPAEEPSAAEPSASEADPPSPTEVAKPPEAPAPAAEEPVPATAAGPETPAEAPEEPAAAPEAASETPAAESAPDAAPEAPAQTPAKSPAAAAEPPLPTDPASQKLLAALAEGTPIEGKVFGFNQGGFHVVIDGLTAFCPRSEIEIGNPKAPKTYVGKTLRFDVLEHRRQGNRFVLSRTKILAAEREKKIAETKAKLVEEAVLEGRVTSLTNFGAFVDLGGGIEGLVHISELAHRTVAQPQDVVKKGQKVKVKVLKIEKGGDRISLSIKALEPDPWKAFAEAHSRGTPFTGTVTSTTDFGVFVEVAPGLEGLIHVSALPPGKTLEDEGLAAGQQVGGWVKEVELKRRRISLSMRPIPTSDPWQGVAKRYPEGEMVTGTVEEIAPFGVFINLEPGLTGLLPNSETKLPRGTNMARVYSPGTEVKVQVARVDAKRKRISLVPEGSQVEGSRTDFSDFKKRTEQSTGGLGALAAAFEKLKKPDED